MYFAIVLFGLIVRNCVASRILAVFPTPSISHQVVFRPLTQKLASRGHELVIITPDPAFPKGETPPNIREIDVHDISYELWRARILSNATTSGKSSDQPTQMRTIMSVVSEIFELQILTEEVQREIKNKSNHFDLIFVESTVRPAVSVSHVFKAPVIYVSSFGGIFGLYDIFGAPARPPLMYPNLLQQRLTNLSLWERLVELYNHYELVGIFEGVLREDEKMIKRLFGPDIPTIHELENNVHMLFLNIYPIWEQNRPVPPSIIFMGGMHQKPAKGLPQDLQSYMDGSKHGVIYISFGTNVRPSSLPPLKIQLLVRTFARLELDVLWKWDTDQLPGASTNIRIAKWFPQSDLLKHPKVKLFITQGGLQSTDEAITAGVPLIGMPMLGDQWFNVEQYVQHKIGLRLDMEHLTEDQLFDAINTVLNDDSYRKNIVRLRSIMVDQPQRPLERAVWWTEHVLRHGGAPHLRARVANISWAEYLDAQLMIALTALVLTILAVVGVALRLLIGVLRKYIVMSKNKIKHS